MPEGMVYYGVVEQLLLTLRCGVPTPVTVHVRSTTTRHTPAHLLSGSV